MAKLNSGNSYVDSLYGELAKQIDSITVSEEEFWNSTHHYAIIHIQWIESLFNWNMKYLTKQDYSRLKDRLNELKNRGAKLIVSRHNEFPHYLENLEEVRSVYNLIYSYTSGIIHLGGCF